ncbi:DNA primase large subunit-like [Tropilaelaps mercedesae]|uniref:DNA primase large subunit n=1 Tax=Tropilaelaps mercedesae TaxID=418985 RepID=A0A1V9XTP9_9ACAR|nr:DNA primase large subunit-like [Tropilaelaps mercedesae]
MQFNQNRRIGAPLKSHRLGTKQCKFTLIDMYENPGDLLPDFCDIEKFYKAAYDRLQVLQTLQQVSERIARNSPEFQLELLKRLKEQKLKDWVIPSQKTDGGFNDKQVDVMSHFTLRLAYCQSEDLRRWFLQWETELFRLRLERETSEVVRLFQEDWNLTFDLVDIKEKAAVINQVISARPQGNAQLINSANLYKVHFTMVPDMVARRRVYVRNGFVYLIPEDTRGIVVSEFRTYLSRMLTKLATCSNIYLKDDQVAPLMKLLARRQIQTERTFRDEGSVTLVELDDLSKDAYPLCMSMMHEWLREKHHLKHTGRLSLTLFLKGIGLSLEDSLKFFGQEFARSIGQEKFNKEYAYAIRHSYGKEGKRADYRPYNCMKMANLHNPSGMECHGCPYKVLETEALKSRLRGRGVTPGVINEVIADVKNFNYQGACTRVFENRTDRVLNGLIVHPNQYFEESNKVLMGTSQLPTENNKIEKVIVKTYKKAKHEPTEQDVKQEIDESTEADIDGEAIEKLATSVDR